MCLKGPSWSLHQHCSSVKVRYDARARQKWGDEFKRLKRQNEKKTTTTIRLGGSCVSAHQLALAAWQMCLIHKASTLILSIKCDLCVEVGGRKGHEVALVTFSVDKCAKKVKVLIISTLDVNTESRKSSWHPVPLFIYWEDHNSLNLGRYLFICRFKLILLTDE